MDIKLQGYGNKVQLAIIALGLSGIIAEILLLREMWGFIFKNEFYAGIVLANWVILESAGSLAAGKFLKKLKSKQETFFFLTLLFVIFFFVQMFILRDIRFILKLGAGESPDFIKIFFSSFLILLPVSITHGALFPIGCEIFADYKKKAFSIGKTYIYETIGTALGGIIFTFIMNLYFSTFEIIFFIGILNISLLLLFFKGINKFLYFSGLMLLSLFLLFAISGNIKKIDRYTLKLQWGNQDVVYSRNSFYGNITVIKKHNEHTFFVHGEPIMTIPNPDIQKIEEFIHFGMLSCQNPSRILLLSGGAGGVLTEILKYTNVKSIDYLEIDPFLFEVLKKFSHPLVKSEINNPKVNIIHIDGRLFIRKVKKFYDIIFISFSIPSDLQVNRFFTLEFFQLLKKRLNKNGIVILNLPGSLSYLSEDLRELNLSIYKTIKKVFAGIKIIPGELNIYLFSQDSAIELIDDMYIIKRLKQQKIKFQLITEKYIQYKMAPRRLKYFLHSIKEAESNVNRDFKPKGVFYATKYFNSIFAPQLKKLFQFIAKINIKTIFIIILILYLFLFLFVSKKRTALPVILTVFSSGICGMLFDLLIISSFQIFYGTVYYYLSLLITIFMIGTGMGGYSAINKIKSLVKEYPLLIKIEFFILLLSLFLCLIFILPVQKWLSDFIIILIFIITSFFSGFLIGYEYPLANKIYLKNKGIISESAGILYATDLAGGWLGGIFASLFLFPVLGLIETCIIIGFLKFMNIIFLYKLKIVKLGSALEM